MTDPTPAGQEMERTLAAGETVDGFRLLGLAGRGGMGEVYRALDTRLQREVAIKILSENFTSNAEFAARFEREARAASALTHPNIAQVYSTGRLGNRPYYVMEFVQGRSLAEILEAEGPITGFRCLDYLIDACVALGAAYEKGIIHRDIKPDNLMIDSSGRLKIVDFGLARWMAEEGKLTQTNMVIGTPNYMAPEQIMGKKVDHRADIYSLGTTFYHLFSGSLPFSAESAVGIMMMHVNDEPPLLKDLNPRIPQAVCAIIEKMMAKRPEDRYQSYSVLMADLKLARSGNWQKSVAAQRPAPRRAPEPKPERNRLAVAAFAGLAIAVVVLGIAYLRVRNAPGNTPSAPAVAAVRTDAPAPEGREDPDNFVRKAGGEMVTISGPPIESPAPPPETATNAPAEPAREAMEIAGSEPEPAPAAVSAPVNPHAVADTEAAARRASGALGAYMEEGEPLPRSLGQLGETFNLQEPDLKDGWGNLLKYEPQGARGFRLTSAGPDGQFGTGDDLVFENGNRIK